MAMALAESLILCGGFDVDSVWEFFRAWYKEAVDVGINTGRVLRQTNHEGAAEAAHRAHGQSASNGSIMRIAPVGVFGVRLGRAGTICLAIEQSDVTHFDRAAATGAAIVAEVIRRCIVTGDFDAALGEETFVAVAHELGAEGETLVGPYRELLSPKFNPYTYEGHSNGSAWVATAQAVWAIRTTTNFHDAIVAAIELGGDTDTVAAITGAMAGAVYGIQGIPVRWTTHVHGYLTLPTGEKKHYRTQDLLDVARCLLGLGNAHMSRPDPKLAAKEVHVAGVFAANLEGAADVDPSVAVVSLCLVADRFVNHSHRRLVFLRDEPRKYNPNLHFVVRDAVGAVNAFLQEGKKVVVHCHGGRSRTALVLKAWYMQYENKTHDEAHEWLSDTWPHYATWNDSFWDYLENEWTAHLSKNQKENK
jgi:ADP-ribosyl-[dinitrogen reductase] hydrolase